MAEGAFDASDIRTSADLGPSLRKLSTEQPSVLVEMPPDDKGKTEILELKSTLPAPPFLWRILVLANKTTEKKNLVLSVSQQKFTGSKLFLPIPPGSVVRNIVQTDIARPVKLNALGEDAYEISLEPSSTKNLAVQVASEPLSVTLWNRNAFDSQSRSVAFFRGAILGIALLLALSMLLLYTNRTRASFLSGGLFAIVSVAFMALEVGYFAQPVGIFGVFEATPSEIRAVIESLLALSLLLFFITVGELRRTIPVLRDALLVAVVLGLAFPVYAFVQPLLVSAIARIGFAIVAVLGFLVLLYQRKSRPAESALLLWSSVVLWTFVAGMAMLLKSNSLLFSLALLLGLTAVLIFMSLRFVRRAAGNGFLSQSLFQEAGRRGLALAGAQQYVWDWNPEDRELYVSEELEQALGHPPGSVTQLAAESMLEIMHPADRVAYLATLENAERRGRGSLSQELRLRRGDGSYRWFDLRARGMVSSDNRLLRCIGTLSDITNTKRTEERLLSDAVYDQVTRLPNRALFLDRLTREMAKKTSSGLYVILVDIDRFKTVNDGLGHEAGDSLLTAIGRRIEALLGPDDTVARFPGDQFAILFAGTTPENEIAAFAELVRGAVAKPIVVNQQEIFLTACLGAANCREGGLTAEQLMKDAAIALYEAKRRGKEMIQFFQTSMRDDRSELVALEAELRRALERNEIEVHYQPIARLADMDLAGFEALVRWRHPALGLLAPESFLGLAEQTGMINDIGRFVLNEATHQLGIWQRAFRPSDPIFMSVNVSASQLSQTNLVLDIRAAISREAVYRQTLKIEVTESVVMQFPEKAAGILEQVKQLGVGLACDDFGTGYSSLSSLRNLPFDTLKVDRSFIIPESNDERAAIILEAIVSLAHDLGLSIVAEGIEDQSQVNRLGLLECDYGQGFFIGQPMTAKQVTEALSTMPYVNNYGKTAISSLWERANHEPAAVVTDTELTTETINIAISQQAEELAARNLAAAEIAKSASPALESAPQAPRALKPASAELPEAPLPPKTPAKKPVGEKKKPRKKSPPKKAAPAPQP